MRVFVNNELNFVDKTRYAFGMSLKTFIRDDLAARIQGGQIGVGQLTLQSIAKRYEVSLTPVRTAVAELTEMGVLAKDAHGRLTIREPRLGNEQLPLSPPERPVDVYARVEDYLVRLSLCGQAKFLREEGTARKFQVSRSQLRNIFSRLSSDSGLLEHVPRRGWRLRPFRQEDMDAFREVRVLLEVGALKAARLRLVEEDLRGFLAKNVVPESEDEPVLLDNRLHAYIIEKAQNVYISDFFNRQGRYFNLLAEWERINREEATVSAKYHRVILEALIDRDWEAAEAALVEHINRSQQKLPGWQSPGVSRKG